MVGRTWAVNPERPPPRSDTPAVVEEAVALSRACPAHRVPGMERRCAAAILVNPAWTSAATPVPFQRFEERPCFEAVLVDHWHDMTKRPLGRADYNRIASDLTGKPMAPRTGPTWCDSVSTGRPTEWPTAAVAAGWRERLTLGSETAVGAFAAAVFAYGQTILSHPYPDGNGRLARALFTTTLAREAGLAAPTLVLGPIFYANHKRLAAAVRTVGIVGEWGPLVEFLTRALEIGLTFGRGDLERGAA